VTLASSDTSLHETFSRLARKRPNAIALVCGSSRMTYGELERLANEGAASLRAKSLGQGDLVAIRSDRSIQMIVTLLSVLKAGAFFAVVDPTWPEQRTSRILDILKPRVFVDLARGRDPEFLAEPATGKATHATNPKAAMANGENPCCVFFTSGTTGEPKAVLTSHRALARLFQSPTFATFGPGTVMPLAAPPAWDAFALELWGALLNGGVALLVDEPYLSPAALRSGIIHHGLETVWLTSSLFNMFVEEDCGAFAGLRQVIIGGERLSVRHVRTFLHQHADIALINGYGPVESAVFTTTHRIIIDDCNREHGIPLGIAVPETRIFILDGTRLCVDGERGEICIAGHGLAIGYLGDPILTAEKFPVVSLDQNDTQVYRTGDYGYIGKEGLLHYDGRGDRQVKIRGHRIEPLEVENQLEGLLDAVQSRKSFLPFVSR
jgi:mycobactin peptide synthetase MbtE